MWLSLFTIATMISTCLYVAAVTLAVEDEKGEEP